MCQAAADRGVRQPPCAVVDVDNQLARHEAVDEGDDAGALFEGSVGDEAGGEPRVHGPDIPDHIPHLGGGRRQPNLFANRCHRNLLDDCSVTARFHLRLGETCGGLPATLSVVPGRTIYRRGGLAILDYRCDARLHERPVVERHGAFSLSYVRSGSFGYHIRGESFELVPGSILLGAPGDEYECTHDHVCGDECLSVQLAPELLDALDVSPRPWRLGSLPPIAELVVLAERTQAAAAGAPEWGADEQALLLAGRFVE